jgi:hypothetical protein
MVNVLSVIGQHPCALRFMPLLAAMHTRLLPLAEGGGVISIATVLELFPGMS